LSNNVLKHKIAPSIIQFVLLKNVVQFCAIFAGISALIVIAIADFRPSFQLEYCLQTLLAVLMVLALVTNIRQDLLTPLNFIIVLFILIFFVGVAFERQEERFESSPYVVKAFSLVITSFIAFWIGYLTPIFDKLIHKLPKFERKLNQRRIDRLLPLQIISAIVLLGLYIYLVGGLDYLRNLYTSRIELARGKQYIVWGISWYLVYIVFWYAYKTIQYKKLNAIFKLRAGILVLLGILFTVLIGSRLIFIIFVLSLLICGNYTFKRISLWRGLIFLSAAGFVAVSYQLYRFYTASLLTKENIIAYLTSAKSMMYYLAAEFALLNDLALAVKIWSTHYLPMNGLSYLSVFILPIPRFLWAGKPDLAISTLVNVYLFGSEQAVNMGGTTVTAVGEGYVNFGILGVCVNFFLLGIASRIMYKYVRKHTNNPVIVPLYAFFLAFLYFSIRSEISLAFVDFMQKVIPLLLIYKVVTTKRVSVVQFGDNLPSSTFVSLPRGTQLNT